MPEQNPLQTGPPSTLPPPSAQEGTMPESAAPHAEPSSDTTRAASSPERAVPPMPSEVTNVRARRHAAGRWRRATMPLRTMMRRAPRRP
jgi:hypothetical protein